MISILYWSIGLKSQLGQTCFFSTNYPALCRQQGQKNVSWLSFLSTEEAYCDKTGLNKSDA
jgi:hypothetical protein